MTVLEAVRYYVGLGLLPIPIPFAEKAPKLEGWPAMRLGAADLPRYFNDEPTNVGIILGDPYGIADIDIDCPEGIAAAGELLPATGMIFGRASKPRSHWFYHCDPPVRSRRYMDPLDKACLVELRCQKSDGTTGLQTIVPPSRHPEGEEIRFERGCSGHPANIDAPVLTLAVAKVAAVSVLARHWPAEKSGRNSSFIALAGMLARGGWTIDQAAALHRAIYRILWNSQADLGACQAEVRATYEKHANGFKTTGKNTLEDFVDRRVVAAALAWLGITLSTAAQARVVSIPPSFNLEDLMSDRSIVVPESLVEGFLPRSGLVLLGGRPKEGKSWFGCQVALSVVTGQALGGWLKVKQPGRVQLWALEDQFAITKDKMTKLLRGAVPDGATDLRIFAELALPILAGGDQIIRATLKEHPAELFILDSLFKLTGAKQPFSDINQTDYNVIDRVRQIAMDLGCCALIIMHTKKGAQGGNPIENLIGTSGTPAAADAVAELKRYPQGAGKLTITGRSVAADDFELAWHAGPDEWGWTIDDQGDQVGLGDTGQEILAYLEAQGAAKPGVIATALRKSFSSVWNALLRLQDKRKVCRCADKKWDIVR